MASRCSTRAACTPTIRRPASSSIGSVRRVTNRCCARPVEQAGVEVLGVIPRHRRIGGPVTASGSGHRRRARPARRRGGRRDDRARVPRHVDLAGVSALAAQHGDADPPWDPAAAPWVSSVTGSSTVAIAAGKAFNSATPNTLEMLRRPGADVVGVRSAHRYVAGRYRRARPAWRIPGAVHRRACRAMTLRDSRFGRWPRVARRCTPNVPA